MILKFIKSNQPPGSGAASGWLRTILILRKEIWCIIECFLKIEKYKYSQFRKYITLKQPFIKGQIKFFSRSEGQYRGPKSDVWGPVTFKCVLNGIIGLECDQNGMFLIQNMLKMECAPNRMCSKQNVPFWEYALF